MMFRRKALTGLAVLSAVALVPLPFASAQAPQPRRPMMGSGMMGSGMMGRGMMGLAGLPAQLNQPIPGKPFTATAEVSYGQGQTSTVQMARDAAGRTYLHTTLPARPSAQPNAAQGASASPGREVTIIADPVAHKQYTIFPAAKNIEVRPLGPPLAMGRDRGLPRGTTTTLGTQKIAGQQAQGLKTVMNMPARGNQPAMTMTREVWRSEALGVVLKASLSGQNNRQMSFTVQSLKTSAPEASLFQLPAGYTLRQPAAPRGMRSPNRHRRPPSTPPRG